MVKLFTCNRSIDITDSEILSHQASIDDLCGLLNRRAGKEKLLEIYGEKEKS